MDVFSSFLFGHPVAYTCVASYDVFQKAAYLTE